MKEVSLSERPADYSADNGKGAPTHVQLKSTKRWVKTPEGYHRRPEGWMSHIYYRCEDGYEWIETPSIDLLEEWQSDCVCETPTGEMVEPDHPRSWLFILGLI
jgi:hypothetical protein